MQQCGARSPVLSRVVLSGSLTGGDWAVACRLCSRGAGGSSCPPDQCRLPLAGASERIETTSSDAGGPGRALREPRWGATGDSAARSGGMRPARSGSRAPAGSAYIRSCHVPATRTWVALGISAAANGLTEDGGGTWRHDNESLLAPVCRRRCADALCNVHRRARSGCSCSSKRSTDPTTRARRGRTPDHGLPLELGFPMVLDPTDADSPT